MSRTAGDFASQAADGDLSHETDVSGSHHQRGPADQDSASLLDIALVLAKNVKLLLVGPLLVGLAALGITYLIKPTFTATTSFLPPQQPQTAAASALSSLGALSGLVGIAGGVKSPADQYVSLMQSVTVKDRMIDRFHLMQVYDTDLRFEARKELGRNVRIALGKKDGLISVEVDDTDPTRAADMANRHVDELRNLTASLALTEAQQRRVFFEGQLKKARDQLTQAQLVLQSSGFNPGALRAEPKAAAEAYSRLKAEVTSAEVRLQTLRGGLAEMAPEVQQQLSRLAALRSQLNKLEGNLDGPANSDYLGKYREFKYQEALFELFSRQFELARLDESREGALIQVVDVATPPEHKSRPKRTVATVVSAGLSFLLILAFVVLRHSLRRAAANPATAQKLSALREAFSR